MNENRGNPEHKREKLRQEELKRNPSSIIHGGGLADLVGGLGWKNIGIFILILIVGFILYAIFFR